MTTIEEMIDYLKTYPKKATMSLGVLLAIDDNDDQYEVRLDIPISGVALDDQNNEAVFIVQKSKDVTAGLGKITPLQ